LDVGQIQDAERRDRGRIVLEQNGELEVRCPLRRNQRIATEGGPVGEVALQALEDDHVRGDHQERSGHRGIRLVEGVEVRPSNAQAHRHRLAGARGHLDREALTLGLPGLHQDSLGGVVEQVAERADLLDLGQVDERLDCLALAEVEAKRGATARPVLVLKPVGEQSLRRRARARVVLCPPRVDGCSDSVDEMGPLARLAPLGNGVGIAGWRSGCRPRAHLIRTSASFVVSLPKMSMIFTTIE